MCLEAMQRMRWEGIAFLLQYSRDPHALKPFKNILRDGLALSDWNSAFVDANYWYDRQVTALRLPSRFDSLQELKQLRSEFNEELEGSAERDVLEDGFHLSPQTLLTEKLGSIVAGAVSPLGGQTRDIADRGKQSLAIFECAISLELYRTERGAYPRTLDDLAPGYMAVVPRDFFTEEPLIYRLEPNGYVLYVPGAERQG